MVLIVLMANKKYSFEAQTTNACLEKVFGLKEVILSLIRITITWANCVIALKTFQLYLC